MNQTQTQPTVLDDRWKTLVERGSQAAGEFFYAVSTTGVFCRPGCASRLPKREHVRFFNSMLEARQAGFRPCKRCRPDLAQNPAEQHAAVLQACALMDAAETRPTLAELARAVHISPFHFQRKFKQATGVTPKQYYMQKRMQRLQTKLQTAGSVTQAIYAAGFSSSAPFYQQSKRSLGMSPSAYKNGGDGSRVFYAIHETQLGWLLVAATEHGVCAIEFGDAEQQLTDSLRTRFPQAELIAGHPIYSGWVQSILAYLDRSATGLDLPLDIRGTAFQRRVWLALQAIPRGETISYGELARRIGQPTAVRAVAGACAANKIAVAIPCHRVVAAHGDLRGYRWGIERKRRLLDLEQAG